MEDLGLGAGLAAVAFWGFVATVVVAAIWDGVRQRESQHETVRRLIESHQRIDQELIDKLLLLSERGNKRFDMDFKVTGLWILPVAVGLAVFGLILGSEHPEALAPLLGVAGMLACFGIGFLMSAKIAKRWYPTNGDSDRLS